MYGPPADNLLHPLGFRRRLARSSFEPKLLSVPVLRLVGRVVLVFSTASSSAFGASGVFGAEAGDFGPGLVVFGRQGFEVEDGLLGDF